jgi:hypothetical protein
MGGKCDGNKERVSIEHVRFLGFQGIKDGSDII